MHPMPWFHGATAITPAALVGSVRAITNARVHTMETPTAVTDAIAWDHDTITALGHGDVEAWAALHDVTLEDAGGRVIIPGFVDAHMHFLHVGVKRTRPDLRGAGSRQEALDRVRRWLEAHPGDGAVTAEGWDEADWHGDAPPTRTELDDLTGRPLVLRRICGHVAVANSAALPLVQARWNDDRVDAETGVLLEEPSLYLNEALPADDASLDRAVTAACQVAHAVGVTTIGDYEQLPFRAALLRAARDGRLTVRVQCSTYVQALDAIIAEGFQTGRPLRAATDEEVGRPMALAATPDAPPQAAAAMTGSAAGKDPVEVVPTTTDPAADQQTGGAPGGHAPTAMVIEDPVSMYRDGGLKVFLDGSLGGHTALMLEDYDDKPTKGRANWTDAQLDGIFPKAAAANIQLHTHVIGDGAVEQGLQAYERMVEAAPHLASIEPWSLHLPGRPEQHPRRLAHRFEHYEIVHDDQVARTAKLGVWASSQPNFVGAWSAKGGMYEKRIGGRFALNNRFQTFRKAGIRIAFGSDGMPFGPLYGVRSATEHPVPSERLSPAEAVWHYTHEAAVSMGLPVGRLAPGRPADMLLLNVTELEAPATWIFEEVIGCGETRHRGTKPIISDDDVVL